MILVLLGIGSYFLISTKEVRLEKENSDPDQQLQKEEDVTQPVEEPKPATIQVIDPLTNEVIKTFLPTDYGFETSKETYQQQMTEWAKDLARGTETTSGYDQRMVLDKLDENGQILKGNPQIILKESELVERILAVSVDGGDVELPLYVTESGYALEDVPHLDEVIVASYTTYFNTADVGRNKNIELSAAAIHNTIIGAGDIFSFNTMVGPRTEEGGYQPAPEIINKKVVMGIGGGVCQTSSTLFNVVDQVGVKYVERHHHSLSVGYVPAGRDATVSYGSLDFRFENTTGIPFLLKTKYNNGSLTIEMKTSKKYETILK